MASLTLAIPTDLRAKMKQFPEINWSEVARQAIRERTRVLEQMQQVLSKSAFTGEEAVAVGRKIKRRVWTAHRHAA